MAEDSGETMNTITFAISSGRIRLVRPLARPVSWSNRVSVPLGQTALTSIPNRFTSAARLAVKWSSPALAAP